MRTRRSFGPATTRSPGRTASDLRILSGFYGVVKPMDGVAPFRLEMQAKAAIDGYKNLVSIHKLV